MHISTAGQYEPSLGSFWDCFLAKIVEAAERPTARTTLGQVYRAAEVQYYEANGGLKQHNESVAAADATGSGDPFAPLSFGTVKLHEGRARSGRPMTDVAVWDLLNELEAPPAKRCAQGQAGGVPTPCVAAT